jgi:hypothetical protein
MTEFSETISRSKNVEKILRSSPHENFYILLSFCHFVIYSSIFYILVVYRFIIYIYKDIQIKMISFLTIIICIVYICNNYFVKN